MKFAIALLREGQRRKAWSSADTVSVLKLEAGNIKTREVSYSSVGETKQDKYTELAKKLTLEQAARLVCGCPTSEGADAVREDSIWMNGICENVRRICCA